MPYEIQRDQEFDSGSNIYSIYDTHYGQFLEEGAIAKENHKIPWPVLCNIRRKWIYKNDYKSSKTFLLALVGHLTLEGQYDTVWELITGYENYYISIKETAPRFNVANMVKPGLPPIEKFYEDIAFAYGIDNQAELGVAFIEKLYSERNISQQQLETIVLNFVRGFATRRACDGRVSWAGHFSIQEICDHITIRPVLTQVFTALEVLARTTSDLRGVSWTRDPNNIKQRGSDYDKNHGCRLTEKVRNRLENYKEENNQTLSKDDQNFLELCEEIINQAERLYNKDKTKKPDAILNGLNLTVTRIAEGRKGQDSFSSFDALCDVCKGTDRKDTLYQAIHEKRYGFLFTPGRFPTSEAGIRNKIVALSEEEKESTPTCFSFLRGS